MPFLFAGLLAAMPLSPEERALAYLCREVPAWSIRNKCYSCHNNGSGARALYTAHRLGYRIAEPALADNTKWLARPAAWDKNGGDDEFNDRDLARLQFALALLDANAAGYLQDRQPLNDVASAIAGRQSSDGCWSIGPDGDIGSPTTLGRTVATAEARRLLEQVDPDRYRDAIRRAEAWLARRSVRTVDHAAVALATPAQREACLEVLHKGESKDGGWGPYVNASPEPFDTALVLLALSRLPRTAETTQWMRRGRSYLLRTQRPDGSWEETTRPPGAESYAERISTAGWATRALLATRPEASGVSPRRPRTAR
jgi:hypothetical protein